MLAAITVTLNQCTSPDMATPAALAVQGLQELCRAEVKQTSKHRQTCILRLSPATLLGTHHEASWR